MPQASGQWVQSMGVCDGESGRRGRSEREPGAGHTGPGGDGRGFDFHPEYDVTEPLQSAGNRHPIRKEGAPFSGATDDLFSI